MAWLIKRREQRHARHRQAALAALSRLKDDEGYAYDIMRLAGLSSASLYPALAELESAGLVTRRPDSLLTPPKRYLYRRVAS